MLPLPAAWIKSDHDILPHLLHAENGEPGSIGHEARSERTSDHGHAVRSQKFGSIENGHFVHEPSCDETASGLASTFDEETPDSPAAQLIEDGAQV